MKPKAEPFLIKAVDPFGARRRALHRCSPRGVDMGVFDGVIPVKGPLSSFWRHRSGAVMLCTAWMGYTWSHEAWSGSGAPIPDKDTEMDELAHYVMQRLFEWMTDGAADMPPFEG